MKHFHGEKSIIFSSALKRKEKKSENFSISSRVETLSNSNLYNSNKISVTVNLGILGIISSPSDKFSR